MAPTPLNFHFNKHGQTFKNILSVCLGNSDSRSTQISANLPVDVVFSLYAYVSIKNTNAGKQECKSKMILSEKGFSLCGFTDDT